MVNSQEFLGELYSVLTREAHMGQINQTGYSADVRLSLECQGQQIRLSHTAPTFVIAKKAINLPAGENATVVFSVDGHRQERNVTLLGNGTKKARRVNVIERGGSVPF